MTFKREAPNPAVEEARREKKITEIWSRTISDEFFKTFGLPQVVEISNVSETKQTIDLVYQRGKKRVMAVDLLRSGRWTAEPKELKETGEYIKARFSFPEIPEVHVWDVVAFLPRSELFQSFDFLSPEMKETVLEKAKEQILLPRLYADQEFDKFIETTSNLNYILELCNEIRWMQAPGEIRLIRTHGTVRQHFGASPDERSSGGDVDMSIVTDALRVGVRFNEDSLIHGYYGGRDFVFACHSGDDPPDPPESAEVVRDLLTSRCREEIQKLFRTERDVLFLPKPDLRITGISSDEWREQYVNRWNERQRLLEQKWATEDATWLAEKREAWDAYDQAAQQLREIRVKIGQTFKMAKKEYIYLHHIRQPRSIEIGKDSLETLKESVILMLDYQGKLTKGIEDLREKRKIKEQQKSVEVPSTISKTRPENPEARTRPDTDASTKLT